MPHEIELGYIGVEVSEPGELATFLAYVVGLVPGRSDHEGRQSWRNDSKVHRVLVEAGPTNDAVFIGFEAVDGAAFESVTGRLRSAGYDLAAGTDEDLKRRQVERLVHTPSPWGVRVEIVLGLAEATTPYESPLVPGGFLTDGVGFGHAVFVTNAFDESRAFLVEGLGLAHSDWLEVQIADDFVLEAHFFHCNKRHHSVALAKAPFELPQRLHHIMFETNSLDDVGAAFDRTWSTGRTISNGLGRHDNDQMFSFYVASPAGFQVEVGHGARVITDDWDDDRRYDRVSAWGHQPLPRG